MPTLPPLGGQILRGINGYCVDCDASVDRRSKRCRPCHARRLTERRFPVEKRPLLLCIDCNLPVSYASKKGHGRCRSCYFAHKALNPKPIRSASRPNSGTAYEDQDGNIGYAGDELQAGQFTVATAWASMWKCRRGFYAARRNGSEEDMNMFLERIDYLRSKKLNLSSGDSVDLDAHEYNDNNYYTTNAEKSMRASQKHRFLSVVEFQPLW
jgi:hypothetical protein